MSSNKSLLNSSSISLGNKKHASSFDYVLRKIEAKWSKYFTFHPFELKISHNLIHEADKTFSQFLKDMHQETKLYQWKIYNNFTANLQDCNNISAKSVIKLIRLLDSNFSHIEKLTIKFPMTWIVKTETLEDMAEEIGYNLRNIKNIVITFANCISVKDKGITNITKNILSHSKNIQNFTLLFEDGVIRDKGLEGTVHQVERFIPDLQQLKLDFEGNEKIRGKTSMNTVNSITNKFLHLKDLSLNFSDLKTMSDKVMKEMGLSIFTNLKKLERLDLQFKNCENVTSQGLKEFAQGLEITERSLKRIKLCFLGTTKIGSKGMKSLVKRIALYHPDIEAISLNFTSCNINDKGIEAISHKIKNYSKNLKHLTLIFGGCTHITDYGILQVAQNLSILPDLQNLDLKFEKCWHISNQGIRDCVEKIALDMKQLKYLIFDFSCCEKVGEAKLNVLVEEIKLKRSDLSDFNIVI